MGTMRALLLSVLRQGIISIGGNLVSTVTLVGTLAQYQLSTIIFGDNMFILLVSGILYTGHSYFFRALCANNCSRGHYLCGTGIFQGIVSAV